VAHRPLVEWLWPVPDQNAERARLVSAGVRRAAEHLEPARSRVLLPVELVRRSAFLDAAVRA